MVFLNPLYLFAMALTAIPPLVHLFSRRKLEKFPFSSLEFLKAVEKTRVRWWKLREILLLVLRTLAVLLLALALARPVLRGIAIPGLGIPPPTSLAIILDNSFSMGRRADAESGTLFEVAKSEALDVVDRLRTGDEVHLILSSDHSVTPLGDPTHDLGRVRREIERAELSFLPTDHLSALMASQSYLKGSKSLNRAIYLFSDLQRLGFESLLSESLSVGSEIDVSVLEIEGISPANISVESVELVEKLLIPQDVLELKVDIANHGGRVERTPVSLWVGGVKRGQLETNPGPGAKVSLPFTYRVETLGDQVGYVEIEDPSLEADNRRFFSFDIPERVDVLLADGGDPSHPESSESYHLEKALSPGSGLVTPFHSEAIPWSDLSRRDLRRYGVVCLLNGRGFSREVGERLRRFVEEGGGLLIALGDRVEPQYYKDLLLTIADLGLGDLTTGRIDPSKFLTVSQADYSSPILSPFRDPHKGDISLPRFYKVYPLKGGRWILARLSDLSPLLVEGGTGSGRAIVCAAPLNRRWSDLPIRAIYLPLVHRILSYLARDMGRERSALVGEEFSVELRENPRSVKLVNPEGREVSVEPLVGVGSISLNLTGLDLPGIHKIIADGEEIESFSVNVDPMESDLSRIGEEELRRLLPEARLVREDGPFSHLARGSAGSELRVPFLLLAFLLLVGEMVVSFRRA